MSPRITEENKDAIQFVHYPWDKAMNALQTQNILGIESMVVKHNGILLQFFTVHDVSIIPFSNGPDFRHKR